MISDRKLDLRIKKFVNEYKLFINDFKYRYNISKDDMQKLIIKVCKLPETYDNYDLWIILKFEIFSKVFRNEAKQIKKRIRNNR